MVPSFGRRERSPVWGPVHRRLSCAIRRALDDGLHSGVQAAAVGRSVGPGFRDASDPAPGIPHVARMRSLGRAEGQLPRPTPAPGTALGCPSPLPVFAPAGSPCATPHASRTPRLWTARRGCPDPRPDVLVSRRGQAPPPRPARRENRERELPSRTAPGLRFGARSSRRSGVGCTPGHVAKTAGGAGVRRGRDMALRNGTPRRESWDVIGGQGWRLNGPGSGAG